MRLWRHLVLALTSPRQSLGGNAAVSLAAVGTITLILAMAGVNLLVGHTLAGILDQYKSRVSVISISIADGTPMSTVYDFQDQLRTDPRVTDVRHAPRRRTGDRRPPRHQGGGAGQVRRRPPER